MGDITFIVVKHVQHSSTTFNLDYIISKTTIPAIVAVMFFGLPSSRRTKRGMTSLCFHDIKKKLKMEITKKSLISEKCPRVASIGWKILNLAKVILLA